MKKIIMASCLLFLVLGFVNDVSAQFDRISGKNRYETAVEVSKAGWKTSKTVILATGLDFPDALTGAPLAGKYYAPILLTTPNKLHEATKNEIVRLKTTEVIILGGESAISKKVEADLNKMGVTILKRFGGKDRYETAFAIALEFNQSNEAILTSGNSFPDALSIGTYAGRNLTPILLTNNKPMAPIQTVFLTFKRNVYVIGGSKSVSDSIKTNLDSKRKETYYPHSESERIFGADRYGTTAAVIKRFKFDIEDRRTVYLARGTDFADALTGTALAIRKGGTIVLTKSNSVPGPIANLIEQKFYPNIYTIGGYSAIEENVKNEVERLSDNSLPTNAKKIEFGELVIFQDFVNGKKYFKFEVTRESAILSGSAGNFSYTSRILDENLNVLLTRYAGTGFPQLPLRKGTYYLEIDGNSNGEIEDLYIHLSQGIDGFEDKATEKEFNNTLETATPIKIQDVVHSSMASDTTDFYSFHWDKDGQAQIEFKYHPYISYNVTLLDEYGNEKAASAFVAPKINGYEQSWNDVISSRHFKLVDVDLESGQYYMRVEGQQVDAQLYTISVKPAIQE